MTHELFFPDLIFGPIFDDFFKTVPVERRLPTTGFPVVDHYNDEHDNAVLEFALAGYKVKDLKISAEGSTVTVSSEGADTDEKVGLRRIAKRSFKQSYTDRNNMYDLGSLSASFVDGVLKITLPKKAEARIKTFKIVTDKKALTA